MSKAKKNCDHLLTILKTGDVYYLFLDCGLLLIQTLHDRRQVKPELDIMNIMESLRIILDAKVQRITQVTELNPHEAHTLVLKTNNK